ncbi:hypothetical protein AMECASPLE_032701, partial [Ameca splendens]
MPPAKKIQEEEEADVIACVSCTRLSDICTSQPSSLTIFKTKALLRATEWGQAVVKNRNVGRIIDSARIAVRKLEAISYKPILFFGKKEKASNKWVADVITHLEPTATTRHFLEKMQRAYEFLLSKDTSVPVQPHTSTGQQFVPPKEQWADEQTETQICKQEENLPQEQPMMFTKEILSDKLEEPVFVLDLVPVSPPVLCSQSSQKQKRQRSPSPTASTSSPPPVSPTDQPHLQLLHENKRKGCQKCSRQQVFQFEAITGRRTNA